MRDLDSGHEIWYRQPGERWFEALPLGNGRMGAMVLGGVQRDGLTRWRRTVAWADGALTVEDDVCLTDQPTVILFRWHLGTDQEVSIQGNDTQLVVTWPDAEMTVEASQTIEVTQTSLPDCTLVKPPQDGKPDHLHTCLIVRTPGEVGEIALMTCVGPRSQAAGTL